jgi:hypothetical protein
MTLIILINIINIIIIDEDDIFENKVIREVDEDKEEEESVYSTSNKKKSNFHFYLNLDKDSQNIESIRQSLNNVNIKQEILENNKDDSTENDEKENEKDEKTQKKENNKECTEDKNKNDDIINNNEGEKENNSKIEIIKDILINKYSEKYGKNKKFIYINENKFLFDNKYNVIAELNLNNEVIIEIDNNKYNLEEFYSNYGKDEINEIKKEKEKFVYTKKIRFQQNKINNNNEINKVNKKEGETNEHQKKRRKRRIIDDDSEEENNKKEENNEKENLSSEKNV